MEETLALAPRWALLVDPAAARAVIERISKHELPRRTCRPLDGKSRQTGNAELAQFDAALDAAAEVEAAIDQELAEIEPAWSGA